MSEQNRDNIDDILDILKKKKQQDITDGKISDDAPTRIDTAVTTQSSMFDDEESAPSGDKSNSSPKAVEEMPKDVSATQVPVTETAIEKEEKQAPSIEEKQVQEPTSDVPSAPVPQDKTQVSVPSQTKVTSDAGKTTVSVPRQAPKRSLANNSASHKPTLTKDGATISLSDFDSISKTNPKTGKKKKKFTMPGYAKVVIYLAVVLTVSIFIAMFVINTANDIFAFQKPDKEIAVDLKADKTYQSAVQDLIKQLEGKNIQMNPNVVNLLNNVALSIDRDSTMDKVAEYLEEKGVINSSYFFKFYYDLKYSDSSYYTGDIIEGQHLLNSNLSYERIFAETLVSKYSTEIVRVTIPEGKTVYEIVDLFVEKRIVSEQNKAEFTDKLNSLSYEYEFLPEFDTEQADERVYNLEGYLFPDTYDFYVGENLDSIISKFLNNFDRKFEEAYYERAKELGLTVDEIVILASMIQAEGNNDQDYYKISSVFHNRLKNWESEGRDYLNSDATTLYYFQGSKNTLDSGDNRNTITPYNTYLNRGLPPSAICNPGTEAIHAALYPEQTNYYYFYTASSNGVTYFATTEAEHNRNIEKDKNGTIGN